MAIKLVIYENPTMSKIDHALTDSLPKFANIREAAHYRDTHYETAGKPSQMQQDSNKKLQGHSDDERSQNVDDGQSTDSPRQVVKYYDKTPFNPVTAILAALIVSVIVFLTCPAIMAVVGWIFSL